MANYPIEKVELYTFWGGGGSEKVYVLYTHLNVDNYGWLLILQFKTHKFVNSLNMVHCLYSLQVSLKLVIIDTRTEIT